VGGGGKSTAGVMAESANRKRKAPPPPAGPPSCLGQSSCNHGGGYVFEQGWYKGNGFKWEAHGVIGQVGFAGGSMPLRGDRG